MDDDGGLMAAAQAGDRRSFDELVRRYQRAIYSYARRCLRDHARSVEVMQDAFVRAYTYRASYKPEAGSVRGWLFAVAANRIKDSRRSRNEQLAPLDDAASVPDQRGDAFSVYARGELREHVSRALETLEAEHREVIALKYVSELSYEEIAQVLGITVGAAKMRAVRARDALAQRLRKLVEESGR